MLGLAAVAIFGRQLKDIRADARPEYFLFLLLGTFGLVVLVSSVELITLFVALELSSYALYLLVPLRQERPGLRAQMESAAKYVMFGIVATGVDSPDSSIMGIITKNPAISMACCCIGISY